MNNMDTCDVVIVGAAHMDLQLYPVGREVLDVASYQIYWESDKSHRKNIKKSIQTE